MIDCKNPPVLIVATPKSGSSLTVSIFAAHGLWIGQHKPHPGYESFSNFNIHQLLRNGQRKRGDFNKLLARINPENQRWVLKGKPRQIMEISSYLSSFYLIKVHRTRQNVINSRTPGLADHIIKRPLKQMKRMRGPVIHTEDVVRGDFKSLKNAFAYCRMPFDPEIAAAQIKPELWSSLNNEN